jgi:hypothetical protein
VVAAAGTAVCAVEVEGLGRQSGLSGLLVQGFELFSLLGETGGRCDVDLDDARVGGDRHRRQTRIGRWPVALHDQRASDLGRRGLQTGDQVDEVLEFVRRRQEDVEHPVADLGDHRGDGGAFGLLDLRLGLDLDGAHQLSTGRGGIGGVRCRRRPPADGIQRKPKAGRRIAIE